MAATDVPLDGKVDGNFHVGHVLLDCFKRRRPDDILQIEVSSGKHETYASVLARSTRLARCLRRAGYQPGDVITVGGANHLDLRIPFYAATYNGHPVAGVDPLFTTDELKTFLETAQPKVSFCDYDTCDAYAQAAKDLGLDVEIITFDNGENTISKFIDKYDGDDSDEFKPAYFDTEKIYVWLMSTGGTTGVPKLAAFKHETIINMFRNMCSRGMGGLITVGYQKKIFNVSPPQWIAGFLVSYFYPLINAYIVQTTNMNNLDHAIDIINKYEPMILIAMPSFFSRILRHHKPCNLTCLDYVSIFGTKVFPEILTDLRSRVRPDTQIRDMYGQTEAAGLILGAVLDNGPVGSMSAKNLYHQVRLVDIETGREITEPNKSGELCFKGPSFTEYYNNPSETAKVFTEDGWIKSGDLFYKDENDYYYFVDRMKMLIRCRYIAIFPAALEDAILTHPGVLEVCVTSIPHVEDSEHAVACVVRRKGCNVTAQDIKELVIEKLSEHKQLRGGVAFMDELPKTSSGKMNRMKIKEVVLNANRE